MGAHREWQRGSKNNDEHKECRRQEIFIEPNCFHLNPHETDSARSYKYSAATRLLHLSSPSTYEPDPTPSPAPVPWLTRSFELPKAAARFDPIPSHASSQLFPYRTASGQRSWP